MSWGCQLCVLSEVPLNSSSNVQDQLPLSPSGAVPWQPAGAVVVVVVVVEVVVLVVAGPKDRWLMDAAADPTGAPKGTAKSNDVMSAPAPPAKSAVVRFPRDVPKDMSVPPRFAQPHSAACGVRVREWAARI